jgi:23S rRNA (guanine745-N1)-methyltransferase
LACTVRDCAQPLGRSERSFVCPRGHSFDVARAGYINLLQPQDRKSVTAGDSRGAVDARAALLRAGIGRSVLDAVVTCLSTLVDAPATVVAELGSGSGELLGNAAATLPVCGVGIELSTHAATLAARAYPHVTWVVANADRRLPLLDASVGVIVSVHARRNPAECHRVLVPAGVLLVAIPAADDLLELRAEIQGDAVERDRNAALLAEHTGRFDVVDRTTARQRLRLEREQLLQLLAGTYRGRRFSESGRVRALDAQDVTLASDIVAFRKR